jgi:hypothetical protein
MGEEFHHRDNRIVKVGLIDFLLQEADVVIPLVRVECV